LRMKALLGLLCLCVVFASNLEDIQNQFIAFQHKYNRVYATEDEYNRRFTIFVENLKIAEELTRQNQGTATFGVTPFSDLSREEFRRSYLNAAVGNRTEWEQRRPPMKTEFPPVDYSHLGIPRADPTNWNWAAHGVVTGVYNQGQCGSCWAFSATETIESYFALAGHGLHSLSMQQITSCDGGSYGCDGGWTTSAYTYVERAGGIDSYSSYPYTSGDGNTGACHFRTKDREARVTSYRQVSGESGLYHQASSTGPVSVCVDASTWQYYTGGVLSQCPNQIDHCVQLTGYANYGRSGAYWIVRNSWATSWGINGYIYIAIGRDLCAIGDMATVVTATTV